MHRLTVTQENIINKIVILALVKNSKVKEDDYFKKAVKTCLQSQLSFFKRQIFLDPSHGLFYLTYIYLNRFIKKCLLHQSPLP